MAKINPCFKKTFVFFNVLFAIAGIVILVLGLVVQVSVGPEVDGRVVSLAVLYISGAFTFILSVLGAYGAHKEKRGALISFFVLMCFGTIILFRIAVPYAMSHDEIISAVKYALSNLGPLNGADPEIKAGMEHFQEQAKCCGLFKGVEDWRGEVPDSCLCATDDYESDQCQRTSVVQSYYIREYENRMVYSKPCGPVIMYYVEKVMSIVLGILLGLAFLALLATIMSLAMIIRVSAPEEISLPACTVGYQPPKYSELYSAGNMYV